MLFLLLTILTSVSLILIFRALETYNANTFPVIVVNYLTCSLMGLFLVEDIGNIGQVIYQPSFPFAIFLGTMFIVAFNLIGLSARVEGVTATAVAHKLSVVIPVVAAYFLYDDSFGPIKILGIILALSAVYLSTHKPKQEDKKARPRWAILLPILVFVGSGIVDATVKYVEHHFLRGVAYDDFLVFLFATAFILGFLALVVSLILKKTSFGSKELLWGVVLGVPNYGSMYFMIKTLEFSGFESSEVFPLINIGVVAAAAVLAKVIFKEKLSAVNLLGLGLAIIAIILISWYKLIPLFF